MKFASFAAIVVCVAGLGCDRDPASDVKIIARPTADSTSVARADSISAATARPTSKAELNIYVPGPPFRSELCNVEPEKSKGSSTFVVRGPCPFNHRGDVKCTAVADDFYAAVLRQGPGDVTVSVYLNIETGTAPKPGKHTGAQLFLTVQNRQEYYHWSSDSVSAKIGPGMNYVDVPKTRLEAEPPNTGTEIVSGRFWCQPDKDFAPIIVR